MSQRSFRILATFTAHHQDELPTEARLRTALEASTAAEALAEATGCEVSFTIDTEDEG